VNPNHQKVGTIIIIFTLIFGISSIFFLQPIAQDPQYHAFFDQRTILGIPNFWNVISNLPFLVVGLLGIYNIVGTNKVKLINDFRYAYIMFFVGISLVAFGSGYYHIWPDNHSLLWDRFPMTIAFMALFAIIIAEFISLKLAKLMFWPLLIIGASSVYYWYYTETLGKGDLRIYVLVQFLPLLIIPISLLCFRPRYTLSSGYWYILTAYIIAKLLELFDQQTYSLFSIISGHSLKHIAAALGALLLLQAYNKRTLI